MSWEKIAFSELVDFPPKIPLERGELYDNIPMDVVDGRIKYVQEINQRVYTGGGAKFANGDTIFARITPCLENGKIAKVKGLGKEIGFGSTEFFVFRAKEKISDPDFIYYLSKTDLVRQPAIKSMVGASGRQRADKGVVEQIKVPNIPLPTQHRIASILSSYDDLIENNLKRIKLLEEKARIEYKSIIKYENLQINKAVEVLQFTTGKLNSNAAIVNGTYPFFTCGQEILKTNTFSFDEEAVLLGGNNASAIYPVFYFNGKFDAYQRTYIIRPKPEVCISFKYLYFYWESKLDHLRNISTGAATKFLTLRILNDMEIPLPETKVMKDYERLTEPIFKLKAILSEQNDKLREARDILLPKLMSGEIEV
jgi:type I restriction enzyme S subunit